MAFYISQSYVCLMLCIAFIFLSALYANRLVVFLVLSLVMKTLKRQYDFAKSCGFSIRRRRREGKDGVGKGLTRRYFVCHRAGMPCFFGCVLLRDEAVRSFSWAIKIVQIPLPIKSVCDFYCTIIESPRWLAKQERAKDFVAALQILHGKDTDISKEAEEIQDVDIARPIFGFVLQNTDFLCVDSCHLCRRLILLTSLPLLSIQGLT
ncbi:hypothetical protein P8452_64637 [Trifolium repens]|nr:hypothetical protein P8452_64637 [Trifolium repens]